MRVFVTGDTHGSFERIREFIRRMTLTQYDVLIILGDAGFNYYGDNDLDEFRKQEVNKLGTKILSIHGNHEMRPYTVAGYEEKEWMGGTVYVQPDFPNLMFAKDGSVFTLCGKTFAVAGGAYSVDKYRRLALGYGWWADEQPDDAIKTDVEKALEAHGWKVDFMLTHTCPMRYIPREAFLPGLDQSKVDNSTEIWLDSLEERLSYGKWLCGHYHINKKINKLQFMFKDYALLAED